MEFKSLTNIESSFRRIRMMAAVFICCFGARTASPKGSVRKSMYWTGVSR